MDQAMLKRGRTRGARFGVASAIIILFLFAIVSWGGVVGGDTRLMFWLGIVTLIAALGAFVFAVWHLLVRPLPLTQAMTEAPAIKASYRQAIALLLGISSISLVVGIFWDELWHRIYDTPFGEDFFWRPHLLMYFSFLSVSALGGVAWFSINRQLRGTYQQRFRAAPMLALLVLTAAFMMYGLIADPLWHAIYGEDLSAFSIPHVVLLMNFTLTMLVTVAIHRSLLLGGEWRSLARSSLYDVLPLLMFACMLLINLQILIMEYDHAGSFNNPIVQARPEWVMPFLAIAVTSFVGVLANHSLRYFGAATASGLIALAARSALIQLFDAQIMTANAWLLALAPLLALDLWYGFCVLSRRTPGWLGGGVAAALGMLAAYPLMDRLYPHVVITNLPSLALLVLVSSLSAGWLGAQIGDYVGTRNKQVEQERLSPRLRVVLSGTLVALGLFILIFISTAAPPG